MAKSLSHQVGILTAGRLVAYAAMFFVPLVNVRMLSQHDFGFYRQYWLLFETVSGVLVMAFPNSLLYYFPRASSREERSIYLAQTLVFLYGAGLASWGVFGILDVVLGGGLGGVVHDFFWPISLFTLFMIVSQCLDRLFVAEKQVERQSVYHGVTSVLQAATVMAVSIATRRVDLIIYALVVFAFVKFAFTIGYTTAVYRPPYRRITWKTFRDQLAYALPLGLAAIVLTLMARTDKFIITHYMGREMFAVYTIGAFQVPIVDIVRSSISNVTFPLMAEYQRDGRHADILDLWQRATVKTAFIFFPLFILLEVSARPFITVLFTESYEQAVPIFRIYLLLFLRSTIETGAVAMVFKRTNYLLKINIVAFVANLVLSVVFYKWFGWLGVPAATVLVVYGQSAAYMYMGATLLDVGMSRVMPWKELARLFTVASGPGVLLWLTYRYVTVDNIVELAAAAAAYLAMYGLIAYRLRLFTVEELRKIFTGRTS